MTQQQQIIDCEQQLLKAAKSCDIKVLDELLHDDLLFNNPTGQTISKQIYIEKYRPSNMSISKILPSEQIIKIIDDVAIVTVTIYLKAKYADQIIDGNFKYLRVWKLFDKSWKVISGSGFSI
ncbi:nuclear transport factor 2 family protein [Flavobacterium sp.]|uniref:nuclear transport factor 2 family protein n=1 Tax=Flavobacterium sp. TaxID=239 RepID=UPI00286AA3C6|nr:nuclear transport factor 2 family protein [Flavobacterium sp.]